MAPLPSFFRSFKNTPPKSSPPPMPTSTDRTKAQMRRKANTDELSEALSSNSTYAVTLYARTLPPNHSPVSAAAAAPAGSYLLCFYFSVWMHTRTLVIYRRSNHNDARKHISLEHTLVSVTHIYVYDKQAPGERMPNFCDVVAIGRWVCHTH